MGLYEFISSKRTFSLLHIPNTISDANYFNDWGCMRHSTQLNYSDFFQPTSYWRGASLSLHTQWPHCLVVTPPTSAWICRTYTILSPKVVDGKTTIAWYNSSQTWSINYRLNHSWLPDRKGCHNSNTIFLE